jgi:transposase
LFQLGTRCIVLAIGGFKTGVIQDTILVFSGDKKNKDNADYHSDMNAHNFQIYCEEMFPKIQGTSERKTVFCIDNARYHTFATPYSKYPSKSGFKRAELIEWMIDRKIEYPGGYKKATVAMLHDYIRKSWKQVSWVVEFGATFNIIVVFLPPYHHVLMPMEKIWGHVKPIVRCKNRKHSLKDVQGFIKAALNSRTVHEWRDIETKYTMVYEKKYYEATIKDIEESDLPHITGNENGEDDYDDDGVVDDEDQ